MRKFTLILVALFVATTSFARVKPQQARIAKARTGMELNNGASRQLAAKSLAQRKAPRRVADYTLDQQPEGKFIGNLIGSYSGIAYSWLSGFYDSSTDAAPLSIVEGTDGSIYIKGMTPNLYDDEVYWIKAEKQDGNVYVIHKQAAGYYAYYDELDYITRLVYDEEDDYYYEADDTDLKVVYKDGTLSQVNPDDIYGIVYEDEGASEWEGESYWGLTVAPLTETYVVVPEDAKVENMVLQSADGAKEVQVAFVGNQVYVQSYEAVPGWYVGTINGNKVTFKSGQFLGFDSDYNSYEWFYAGTATEEYDEDYDEYYYNGVLGDEIVFDYDPEAKTLTAAADAAMFINASKTEVYYAEMYVAPKLFIFVEVPAVPADPQISYYWPYDEDYESAELDYNIPLTDVDGNYITPSKLSFQVFVDDEAFTFEADEYESFDDDLTELPYGFTDGYWITQSYISFLFDPAKNVGLQSIYRGGGVENRSHIIYYDIENDEVVDGVERTVAKTVASEACYDVAGRRVAAATKGFVLKTVTFADGSKKTYKVVRK